MNDAPTSESSLPVDSPGRRRVPILLRMAWYGLNRAFRRRITHIGVTPDQFTVLRILAEADPRGLTQRELTTMMASDPNTVASLLERMENLGLIERRRHETDRRAHRIRTREGGQNAFDHLRHIALRLQVEVLSALPEERREAFLQDLSKVAEACRLAAKNSLHHTRFGEPASGEKGGRKSISSGQNQAPKAAQKRDYKGIDKGKTKIE